MLEKWEGCMDGGKGHWIKETHWCVTVAFNLHDVAIKTTPLVLHNIFDVTAIPHPLTTISWEA